MPNPSGYEIAAYYFPQFHTDKRNDEWHGPGWTEWELVRAAKPRFPGHRQPIVPAWGYFDEAAPEWAAREIELAAGHGISSFLYDWYWYEDGPFLQGALEDGFLNAPNRQSLKFGLMWANHNWRNIHPAPFTNNSQLLKPGRISAAAFDRMTDYIIKHYLTQPNYLKIEGAPYFSIYELGTFIEGVGGFEQAKTLLARFRAKVKSLGFVDLHINAVLWGFAVLPDEIKLENPLQIVERLGFSSIGSYVWVHHFDLDKEPFPKSSYQAAAQANYELWEDYARNSPLPYYPNVTVGWDASPRTTQTDIFARRGYPWQSMLADNTPQNFRIALEKSKLFADRTFGGSGLVTINAWNEWTEGSYLLPDTHHGTAYLEEVRDVFSHNKNKDISVVAVDR